jgi:hypothetical protein
VLSAEPVRRRVYEEMSAWLDLHFPPGNPLPADQARQAPPLVDGTGSDPDDDRRRTPPAESSE